MGITMLPSSPYVWLSFILCVELEQSFYICVIIDVYKSECATTFFTHYLGVEWY